MRFIAIRYVKHLVQCFILVGTQLMVPIIITIICNCRRGEVFFFFLMDFDLYQEKIILLI